MQVMERLQLVIDSRLKATEEKLGHCRLPRIIRVCEKYKLSENESKLALYALICQAGLDQQPRHGYSPYGGGVDCVSAAQSLDISISEVLAFLAKERLHMQQGLLPDIQESYLLNSNMSYDGDFCTALLGSKLTSNEFLKLEQTDLAKVILEEPGSEYLK